MRPNKSTPTSTATTSTNVPTLSQSSYASSPPSPTSPSTPILAFSSLRSTTQTPFYGPLSFAPTPSEDPSPLPFASSAPCANEASLPSRLPSPLSFPLPAPLETSFWGASSTPRHSLLVGSILICTSTTP